MLQYKAISGQSIWDICLQTYGTFDLMKKILDDNNVGVDVDIKSGMIFIWDETLTNDQFVNQTTDENSTIYATKALVNGSVLSVVKNENSGASVIGGETYYQPTNPQSVVKYQSTTELQYIAAGGETTVILSDLMGSSIIQITREMQPLKTSEYAFNANNGQITIYNELSQYETLYIIYGKIINS